MEGDLGWCCSSNNWDLHAVVRFACGGAPPPHPSVDFSFSWQLPPQPRVQMDELMVDAGAWQPLPANPATADDLCQAFLAAPMPPEPQTTQQPSLPRKEAPHQQTPLADESPAKPQTSGRGGVSGPTRSKRKNKKIQVKKEVTRVPAGAPAEADPWAWRKYGQKPIKGSPYPRGYYRCSTDKDCKARKQAERCRDDPDTFIVTYTAEHSHPVPLHRSSLSGTTRRNKQQLPSHSTAEEYSPRPQVSSSASPGLSPTTSMRSPSVEYEEDEDTLAVRLLLEDVEMADEDDALLFLKPDEAAPGPGLGFPSPDELPPTTVSSSTTDGGAGA